MATKEMMVNEYGDIVQHAQYEFEVVRRDMTGKKSPSWLASFSDANVPYNERGIFEVWRGLGDGDVVNDLGWASANAAGTEYRVESHVEAIWARHTLYIHPGVSFGRARALVAKAACETWGYDEFMPISSATALLDAGADRIDVFGAACAGYGPKADEARAAYRAAQLP